MPTRFSRYLHNRWPIALVGLAFIVIGVGVADWGVWVSHGRIASHPPTSVLVGPATRWVAASLVCAGVALLGVLWPRRGVVAAWMAVWLALAVGLNFVEPVVCKPIDAQTRLCQ
ncbi:MAG: hypothetical protein LCH73_12350 [Proteobacteria bacterium]|nr:hypothetical protein [Pseudomonadota bacterium]